MNPFGVGVAPGGARWISCLACQKETENDTMSSCPLTFLEACEIWLMCPSRKLPCPYRPNVITVSNSCPQNKTTVRSRWYKDKIRRLVQAWVIYGIIPVYSAGNRGREGCQSVGFPSDMEKVITVGSVDINETLSDGSSIGPPLYEYNLTEIRDRGIFKPDFVAPGVKIISTVYTGLEGKFVYDYLSGTSMATPHVAGAIALLLSRNEDLNFTDIKKILVGSRIPNHRLEAGLRKEKCLGLEDYDVNHKFGYGRLQLPNPDDLSHRPVRRPSRKMPPPPDYSDLPDDYDPSQASVYQGISVVIIMMAVVIILKNMLL